MKKAISRNGKDFVATIVLAVIGAAVGIGILAQQSADFPEWVPGLGKDRFELRGEFSTSQAVTPGQGQSVNISGIKVGDVTGVDLVGGRAVVTMEIENEYAELLGDDATMLLRPRTGLQDMTVEIDLGSGGGELEEGDLIPLASTAPSVNADEILAALDGDTRGYLKLLLDGGGRGLGGRGELASAALRRFEPTVRDIARINSALAKRRRNIARVIHNFSALAGELADNDTELAGFISSSASAMGGFADADEALRASLRELPGALSQTRLALGASRELSRELTPALTNLTPGARALAPALRATQDFFERTTGPVRDQVRPFTRRTGPTVRALSAAAGPLADTAAGLDTGFTELNTLFDTLAYNPPGTEEGYLFWLAWLNHNLNNTFVYQDGNGFERRALIMLTCQARTLADVLADIRPAFQTVLDTTRLPEKAEICP